MTGTLDAGAIPEEIGNLQNLQVLGLSSNNLTGTIPPAIFNISTIQFLSLTANQLSGGLPSSIGQGLPNLQQLYLGGNAFRGTIPSSLTSASMLSLLDLAFNSFSGPIPNTLGNLRFLQWLNLGLNNLTDDSPTSELSLISALTNCTFLRKLVLSGNPLNGVIPASVGNLSTNMGEFSLALCNVRGNIPREIGNLGNLTVLNLQDNQLTGSLPDAVGSLQQLQGLYLQNNELQGSIPANLCRLGSLVELYLDNNSLAGTLPVCLGNLISLRTVSLGFNRLTSDIPTGLWILKDVLQLNLSSNSLNGSLPPNVGNLKVATLIDLSRNQLTGSIPITIGSLTDLRQLSLAENKLQGSVPQVLGQATGLEFLDLSSNNLSGVIPKTLESLLYLKYLNLSFNKLEGEIPFGGPFANFSARSFMGNDALCGAPRLQVPACKTETRQPSKRNVKRLLTYVLPISIVLIIIVLAIILLLIRRRKRTVKLVSDADTLPIEMRRVTYHELLQATNAFSEENLLGNGSFGSVFKGRLRDGTAVAIKVFNLQVEGAFRSFDAECEVLRNIRHRNLVKIITSCSNEDFKALVLQYMPNGNLEKLLYSTDSNLDIARILSIMIDVASALEYLHYRCSTPIIHCDLKPSNVLLDDDMVAHLADFGMSKLLGEGVSMTQTQTLATIGYIAPEYGSDGKVSRKGDVYSYGIMLMETLTRKKPIDEDFAGGMSFRSWVGNSLHGSVTEVVEESLPNKLDERFAAKEQCLSSIFSLALACTTDSPEMRIDMKEVVVSLQKIRVAFFDNSMAV